jgi:hypothetical protein
MSIEFCSDIIRFLNERRVPHGGVGGREREGGRKREKEGETQRASEKSSDRSIDRERERESALARTGARAQARMPYHPGVSQT